MMPRTIDAQERILASPDQSRARNRKSSLIDLRYARDSDQIPQRTEMSRQKRHLSTALDRLTGGW